MLARTHHGRSTGDDFVRLDPDEGHGGPRARELVVIVDQDGLLRDVGRALDRLPGRADLATILVPLVRRPSYSAMAWGLDGVSLWLDLVEDLEDHREIVDANVNRVRRALLATAARTVRRIDCRPRVWFSSRTGSQHANSVRDALRRIGTADIVIDPSNELLPTVERCVQSNPALQIVSPAPAAVPTSTAS